MLRSGRTSWRMRVVIGCLAGAGALSPLAVRAQADQPAPSGAAVEVGGVTAPSGALVEVEGVTAPGGLPATGGGPITSAQPSVAGAQGRPLILPNTGGGPEQDVSGLFALLAGVVLIGSAAYLRRRGAPR